MVQWLKLCAPNTGSMGLRPGQGTKVRGQKNPKTNLFYLYYLFHEYSNNVSFLVNFYQCLYVFLIHLYDELYEQERHWSPIYLKYLLHELKN